MNGLNNRLGQFKDLKEYRKLYISFLGVTFVAAVSDVIAGFLGSAIGGNLIGPIALSASFASMPMMLAFSTLGNLFCGGSILASHALGKNDTALASAFFKKSLLWGLVVSILGALAFFACGDMMAQALGGNKATDIVVAGGAYVAGFAFSGVPMVLILALTGFTRIDGSKNIPAVSIGVISVANIALDFVLAPALGVFGLAFASTIAYFIGLLPFIWYFVKPSRILHMRAAKGVSVSILSVLKTGAPLAFNRVCSMVNVTVLGILCFELMGENGLLIANVRGQCLNIALSFIYAFAQSAVPNLGKFYGASDVKGERSMMVTAFIYGIAMSIATCALYVVLSGAITSFMGVEQSDAVFPYVQIAVMLLGVNIIVKTITFSSAIFYQVTGREGVALFIHALDTVVVIIPVELIMFQTGDINCLWYAAIISDVIVLTSILVMNRVRRKYGLFSQMGLSHCSTVSAD